MLARWTKRILAVAVLIAIAAVTVYALWPAPVLVDIAKVDRGPLTVTIDEEGSARIRDVFRVSAPVAGALERIPVHVGETVQRDVTAVAAIRPAAPAFLDVRSRRELEAGIDTAQAAVGLAEAQLNTALTGERQATADLARAEALAAAGTIPARALEEARTANENAKSAVAQAQAELALRQSQLASARARLIEPDMPVPAKEDEMCCLDVPAPIDGVVLRLLAESAQVVTPGTPLVELGDPADIEIVVHLLSSDAVAIGPGAPATLTDWGGPSLNASVRRVDPAGYTKVSALGIEEQRVDAVLDILDPRETWQGLGHSFRVMVHIETWSGADVVLVPIAALFRRGADWNVFRIVDGRAVLTRIVIDHRNQTFAEVTDGLKAGDLVILHPSDKVSDGASVEARQNGG
jgi:HlyD family secretion protein